jgi:hypothetical protein
MAKKPLMKKKDIAALPLVEIKILVKIDAANVRSTLSTSTGRGAPVNDTVTLAQILEARPTSEHEELRATWTALDPIDHNHLSEDALVLCYTYFRYGSTSSLKIGGLGAQSTFSERGSIAMQELVEKGFIVGSLFNGYGRLEFIGTERAHEAAMGLSFAFMKQHSQWSATEPVKQDK